MGPSNGKRLDAEQSKTNRTTPLTGRSADVHLHPSSSTCTATQNSSRPTSRLHFGSLIRPAPRHTHTHTPKHTNCRKKQKNSFEVYQRAAGTNVTRSALVTGTLTGCTAGPLNNTPTTDTHTPETPGGRCKFSRRQDSDSPRKKKQNTNHRQTDTFLVLFDHLLSSQSRPTHLRMQISFKSPFNSISIDFNWTK